MAPRGRKPAWHESRAGNLGTTWPDFGMDIRDRHSFKRVGKRQSADVAAGMVRIDGFRVLHNLYVSNGLKRKTSRDRDDDARRRVDAGPNRGSLEQAIVNEVKS